MGPMRKRWWIGAPLAWVGVVALVALLAWSVIDNAGEGVLADAPRDPVVPSGTVPGSSSTSAEIDEGPTLTPEPSSDGPSTPGSTEGSGSAPPTTESDPDVTTDAVAPAPRTSTWQGEAGTVRVSCTGSSIQLEGASPSNGYEVDQNDQHGGSELRVRFESFDGDLRTEIEARCVNGTPDFSVEVDND